MTDKIDLREIEHDCNGSDHTATGVRTQDVRALVAAVRALRNPDALRVLRQSVPDMETVVNRLEYDYGRAKQRVEQALVDIRDRFTYEEA